MVNTAYDNLIFVCFDLSENDLISGTSFHKLKFNSQFWVLKMTVQEWIDNLTLDNVEAVAVPTKSGGGGDEMANISVVTSQIALVGVPRARPLLGGSEGMLPRENLQKST